MMTFRKTVLAVAVAGTFALGAAGPAQAYVMAGSVLNMTDFQILGTFGDGVGGTVTRQVDVTDFSAFTFTGTADVNVSLTGFTSQSDSGITGASGTSINLPALCIGNACSVIGEDVFPNLLAPPATGNYSAADQFETGSPISGIPNFPGLADVANAAYTGIDVGSATASSTSNNNLNSSFIFSLNQDTGITFSFILDAFLQVAMTADEVFPGTATAAASMSFTVVDQSDGSSVLDWNPLTGTGLSTLSLNAPIFAGVDTQFIREITAQSFQNDTLALTAGTAYQASFRMTTEADAGRVAMAVPEPTALSLLGIGLLGLGASRKLLRKTAA